MVATSMVAPTLTTTTLADNSSAGVEQTAEETNLLARIDNKEVTTEELGIPGEAHYKTQYYARNIWDMAVKDGKVLLSMGDYTENTGAVPIYYYTNASKEKKECISYGSWYKGLSSEAIERFFRIDGEIYATSTDPINWKVGSYYKYDSANNKWSEYASLPMSVHCYDMIEYNGDIFFAGMERKDQSQLEIVGCVQKISKNKFGTGEKTTSVDFYDLNGKKYESVYSSYKDYKGNTVTSVKYPYWRAYDIFEFRGDLYVAHTYVSDDPRSEKAGLFRYDKEKNQFNQVYTGKVMKGFTSVIRNRTLSTYANEEGKAFLDENGNPVKKPIHYSFEDNKAIYEPLKIGKETIYSEPMCGAKISTPNTFVAVCNGIFKSKDVKTFEQVSLGKGYENYVTRDAFELGGKYYFLASQMNGIDDYTTAVFETDGNFKIFRKVLSFKTNSFARCFAYNDGMLYVGIGTYEASKYTGMLYRVDLSKWISQPEEPTTEQQKETTTAEPTTEKKQETTEEPTTEKKQETTTEEPTTEKKQETQPVEPTTPSTPAPSVPVPSVPVPSEPETPATSKHTTVETREDGSSIVTTQTEGITVVVNKNSSGNITSAKAYCTITGSKGTVSAKASVSKELLQQVTSLSGTNQVKVTIKIQVPVVAKQKDLFIANQTQTAYTVTLNANDVKENNPLYIYAYDSNKKQYTMVNATIYRLQKDGSLSINVPAGKAYVLLNKTDMTKVSNKILSTVKLAATTKTMKPDKKTKVTLSKSLDMTNVKKVTYSVSNKKLATVSSKGVVTCKKKGTVTVKVKVTLKNGKTKNLSMKIKINK